MNWSDLSMSQRSELMSIYLKNGISSLEEMKKHYNSFAEGGFASPDHDPNNPYHYHVNGQKIVVTPEDWEKYKDDPTFREVRAAVEAEQAAHTGPEYDEIENPAWRTAYQRIGLSLPNYWNGKEYVQSPLPNGYSRDSRGVAMDANGNYYAPVKDMSYWNPNVPFFVNNERSMVNGNTVSVRYEQVQMPERTIRQLRQPLPVDRVINVDTEKDRSISDYQNNNKVFTLEDIFDIDNAGHSKGWVPLPLGSKLDWNNIYDGDNLNIFSDAFTKIFGRNIKVKDLGRESYDAKFVVNLSEEEVNTLRKEIQKRTGREFHTKPMPIQPSRKEAEKKAVISIGDLEKVGTFANGGSLDDPPERFFGIATPEVTDNNIYYSRNSLLPEVNIIAKGDPRKVNNDYYKAHAAERAAFEDRIASREDYKTLNPQNLLEYTPVIGDALDVGNIINDAANRNFLSAGIGAGMFLLPNIIEKPLKKLIKKGVRSVTNALDGDLSSPFSQKNTTEFFERMMWDTYLANPTKSGILSPVSSKAVTEIDFPESSINYYENSVFPRMLKDPDRVAITSNGSEGRESIMLDDMRSIFEKKPYVGDERFWNAYNNYRNAEGEAVGLYSFLGDNIFTSPTTNGYSPIDHELRHRLQNYMPRTDNEDRLLRRAYNDTDGIISNYDMSQEWETMNLDGRQALIGNSNRDIEHQNSLLELTSEDYGYTINKLYKADGYWKRYIDKLTKDFDGPIEAWANTSEGRKKIHNWIQAMKYVGILSLPLIPSDNNSYANGGPLMVLPSENSIIGGLLPFRPRPRVNKVLNLDVEQNLINKSIEIANNTSEEKKRKAIEKDLQKVPKERIKDLQRALADKGYYDTNYRGNTKKLQETLVEKGYLDNSNGKEIDGIYGPKTHEAYIKYNRDKQVDGVIGNKTKEAYYNYKYGDNAPLSKLLPKGEAGKCAAFVSKLYDNVYNNGKQAGVYGNAWNMLHNIELSGGNVLFNIYTDNTFKSLKNSKDLINKTNNYLDTHKLDYTSLSSGDVVGIYIQSSNHHSDVLKTGDTYNTHVGYVIGKDKDGVPLIQHTINGKILKERIDSLSGSMWGHRATVVAAARPKKTGVGAKSLIWENKKSHKKPTYNPYTKENPAVKGETNIKRDARIKNYLNGLEGAKENIAQLFPDADLDLVENISIAILKRETGYMRKTKETSRANKSSDKVHKLLGTPEESISQNGVAKLKFASFSPVDRKILGLTEPKQLNDPAIAARCVMYLLARNNDYLNRYAKKYNNLTPEEIRDATILSYNQGMQKLRQLGFNDYGDSISTEWLTELENPKNIQKTTNKIGKGLQKLGLESIANWDIFKDENIPYIAATIQEMNKIKSV